MSAQSTTPADTPGASVDQNPANRASLWRHSDFLKLWTGQSISQFGTQVTTLAIPLMAVLLLNATPAQMGVLGATQFFPYLVVGLVAGVWVDRLRRRPILIATDLGRGILLALIPLSALLHILRIEYLYVVSFLVGCLTVFFEVAYASYLPSLIDRDQLVDGNGKLQTTTSAAQVVGPGLAGGLVQLITAPFAVLVDAISFIVSALFALAIRVREPLPDTRQRRHLLHEIAEGLRVVWTQPVLRALAACGVMANTFVNVYVTVYAIFAIRELGFSPALFGALAVASGIGGLLGSMVASRIARRWGIGRTLVGAQVLAGTGGLGVSLVHGPIALAAIGFAGALVLWDMAVVVYSITAVSFRQTLVPTALQGRVMASVRVVTWGIPAVGFVLGGFLGENVGIRPTILIAGLGVLLSAGWIAFSPASSVRDLASVTPLEVRAVGDVERVTA